MRIPPQSSQIESLAGFRDGCEPGWDGRIVHPLWEIEPLSIAFSHRAGVFPVSLRGVMSAFRRENTGNSDWLNPLVASASLLEEAVPTSDPGGVRSSSPSMPAAITSGLTSGLSQCPKHRSGKYLNRVVLRDSL